MNKELQKLQGSILKQAIRDVASKDPETSQQALFYFNTDDFASLCEHLKMDKKGVKDSITEMYDYPIISRKKIANKISGMIDKHLFMIEEDECDCWQ